MASGFRANQEPGPKARIPRPAHLSPGRPSVHSSLCLACLPFSSKEASYVSACPDITEGEGGPGVWVCLFTKGGRGSVPHAAYLQNEPTVGGGVLSSLPEGSARHFVLMTHFLKFSFFISSQVKASILFNDLMTSKLQQKDSALRTQCVGSPKAQQAVQSPDTLVPFLLFRLPRIESDKGPETETSPLRGLAP